MDLAKFKEELNGTIGISSTNKKILQGIKNFVNQDLIPLQQLKIRRSFFGMWNYAYPHLSALELISGQIQDYLILWYGKLRNSYPESVHTLVMSQKIFHLVNTRNFQYIF